MTSGMIRHAGRRWLLLSGLVLAHVVPACTGGAESGSQLNPQPLPPRAPERGDETSEEGTGGSASPPNKDANDGGTNDGDAGPG